MSGNDDITLGTVQHLEEATESFIGRAFGFICRTIVFLAPPFHAIIAVLGVNEFRGMEGLTEMEWWWALPVGFAGGLCGLESLFLETPNSQRRFREIGYFIDRFLDRTFKLRAASRWLRSTKLFQFFGAKVDPDEYSPREEKITFHWEYLLTYSPLYLFFGNFIVALSVIFNKHSAKERIKKHIKDAEALEAGALILKDLNQKKDNQAEAQSLRDYADYLEDISSYTKNFLGPVYLFLQPIIEPFIALFGSLAGASEFWMGVSAFLVFLTHSTGFVFVDVLTGGLATPAIIILGVLFSVAYTNTFFLGGMRAVNSMRDFARGKFKENWQELKRKEILRQPKPVPKYDAAADSKTKTLDITIDDSASDCTALESESVDRASLLSNTDSVNNNEKIWYARVPGVEDTLVDESETQYVDIGEGKTSTIFIVDGKPLTFDETYPIDDQGNTATRKRLYTISDGDVVRIRENRNGDFIVCHHNGRPFLHEGKPLLWTLVETLKYEHGCPLFDAPGVPVLDKEGNLVLVKNKLPSEYQFDEKTRTYQNMVMFRQYQLSGKDKDDGQCLKKGRAEYFLTRHFGLGALGIGMLVACGVGMLGVSTLLGGFPAIPIAVVIAICVVAGVAYSVQNGFLQGTEVFELMSKVGAALDRAAQKRAGGIDAEVKTKHYFSAILFSLLEISWNIISAPFKILLPRALQVFIHKFIWHRSGLAKSVHAWLHPDKPYVMPEAYQKDKKINWKRLWLQAIFEPIKKMIGFFGPLLHGGEAFRGVHAGFPKFIGLLVTGSVIAAVVWTPPGWLLAVLGVVAVLGMVVVALQNRALEVRNAHEALDHGLDAASNGGIIRDIFPPELINGCKAVGRKVNAAYRWCFNLDPLIKKDRETFSLNTEAEQSKCDSYSYTPKEKKKALEANGYERLDTGIELERTDASLAASADASHSATHDDHAEDWESEKNDAQSPQSEPVEAKPKTKTVRLLPPKDLEDTEFGSRLRSIFFSNGQNKVLEKGSFTVHVDSHDASIREKRSMTATAA